MNRKIQTSGKTIRSFDLFETFWQGKPRSRAVLWSILSFPVCVLTLRNVPLGVGLGQIADIVHPDWITGENQPLYSLIPVYSGAIILWLTSVLWIWQLDHIHNHPHAVIREYGTNRETTRTGKAQWRYWMVDLYVNYLDKQFTFGQKKKSEDSEVDQDKRAEDFTTYGSLMLAASVLGLVTIGFPVLLLTLGGPKWFALQSVWALLVLIIHIGTMLSVCHLSIMTRRHGIALLCFVPLGLVYSGVASVDDFARRFTATLLGILIFLPILTVAKAKGLRRTFTRVAGVAWLAIGLAGWITAYKTWNFQDQTQFWHQSQAIGLVKVVPYQKSVPGLDLRATSTETTREAPPVFLNFGGGGTRASMFNALILQELWFTPIEFVRLPSRTDSELEDHKERLDARAKKERVAKSIKALPKEVQDVLVAGGHEYAGRLLLLSARYVSSVSGGSVTSAVWNARVAEIGEKLGEPGRECEGASVVVTRATALKHFFEDGGSDVKALQLIMASPNSSIRKIGVGSTEFEALDNNKFIKLMRRNMLAPTILGLFSPNGSRSLALQRVLGQEDGGLGKRTVQGMLESESNGLVPYAIYNATLTSTGERFAITNLENRWFCPLGSFGPALESGMILPKGGPGKRFTSRPGQVVTHNSLKLAISDDRPSAKGHFEYWNPPLSMAAWVSSDFPYGFPINRMKLSGGRSIGSTDGGLSDNLGVNTTMSLIRRGLVDAKLDQKGFFVFDIDTSYPPSDPEDPSKFKYHLSEASNATFRAQQAAEQTMWSLYVTDLHKSMGGTSSTPPTWEKICTDPAGSVRATPVTDGDYQLYRAGASGKRWGWYRVRNGERAEDAVPTSWYLSRENRAKVYKLALRQDVREILAKASQKYVLLALE